MSCSVNVSVCLACLQTIRNMFGCVCCNECNVVSNEPTSCLVRPIGTHRGEIMYFVCVCFWGELGFLNCDDICTCVPGLSIIVGLSPYFGNLVLCLLSIEY